MDPEAPDTYRLSTDTTPIHYDLTIRTDLQLLSFDGAVEITIRFNADTANIMLRLFELEIGTTSLVLGDETLTPTNQTINTDTQRVTFTFAKAFSRGVEAVLRITFRGMLGSISGYYKSEWMREGKAEYYSSAFLQPTYARRVFPCWDEPALKATFAVSLISRAGTVNLSNMPSFLQGPYDPMKDPLEPSFGIKHDPAEWIMTRFETTPEMSTYLVAFANGPFEHLESSYTSPLNGRICPVRVYATPDLIGQARSSVDLITKVLPILEDMFDLEYPLPKMDYIRSIDLSLSEGALENWGLIVGHPNGFLFDPAKDSTSSQKRVVYITSHELAHQWFGNVVTMEWWDNLLPQTSEVLNSWKRINLTPRRLYPEWNISSAFVNDTLKQALNLDSRLSSHPVQVECPNANHVDEIMDDISYLKAASLLWMLSSLLGEDLFFKGVALYLKERQFGNSVARDLWDALSRASGTDVANLMENWIFKTGYPVITVTEAPGGVDVRQNHFLASGIADDQDDETIWCVLTVPLNILTFDSEDKPSVNKSLFLSERHTFIPLDTNKPFKLNALNASSTGFYRVLYDSEKFNRLALEVARVYVCDRVGLMNDAMALAKANLVKLSSALTLIDGFAGEKNYILLEGIAANLDGLRNAWWESPSIIERLASLDRYLFVPLVAQLGYEYPAGESSDTAAVRTFAIKRGANAGDPSIVTELKSRFAHVLETNDPSRLPPDLIITIYSIAVRHGGRQEYEKMWDILKAPKSPAEEAQAILFNATSPSPSYQLLIAETFARLLSETDGHIMWLFHGLDMHLQHRRPLLNFFKDNYDTLYSRFDTRFDIIMKLPFQTLATEQDYSEIEAFFKTKDASNWPRSVDQILESIRGNKKYLERSTAEITKWFDAWEGRQETKSI
ncbi:leucyl aminopeptidase [Mycena latifolia]|nr:leucyl aminopeptidase [Mycena latifolia]